MFSLISVFSYLVFKFRTNIDRFNTLCSLFTLHSKT
nr:MAG TPA: hypothetical protein [Crassvirales sp.]